VWGSNGQRLRIPFAGLHNFRSRDPCWVSQGWTVRRDREIETEMTTQPLIPMVAITGAGISAESGVPTFRGKGGIWENYAAQDLATPQAFTHDPALVWRFYAWRRELVAGCSPNLAHQVLAQIEHQLRDFTLITQNIDGLHAAAGSKNIIELHGSLWRMRCTHCGNRWEDHRIPLPEPIPHCPNCDSIARPDVIWFGESLDSTVLESAFQAATRANLVLIIGTSAVVQPVASIPLMARSSNARLVEINLESTPLTPHVDQFLQGPATIQLTQWWEEVRPST
jgi:NAD-dependent deacetylase